MNSPVGDLPPQRLHFDSSEHLPPNYDPSEILTQNDGALVQLRNEHHSQILARGGALLSYGLALFVVCVRACVRCACVMMRLQCNFLHLEQQTSKGSHVEPVSVKSGIDPVCQYVCGGLCSVRQGLDLLRVHR